jgi:hyperosmotically inducible periplasmic protein
MKTFGLIGLLAALGLMLACSSQNSVAYKDSVETALKQADLSAVSVSEDKDKNTITLTGTLHSDDAKSRAGEAAKMAAGGRIIANEISVQPVGAESEAKDIASNLDDGIEKNFKAALIAHHLDKQKISFDVKNGVITLTGKVQTASERKTAENLAKSTPNVQQVVDQLEVKSTS